MIESKEVFGLDEREKIVKVGDFVLFTENNNNYFRKVWDIRCVRGNYEVKVMDDNGGWKKQFWKLADN